MKTLFLFISIIFLASCEKNKNCTCQVRTDITVRTSIGSYMTTTKSTSTKKKATCDSYVVTSGYTTTYNSCTEIP
jgi:uncharacterized lipoprotein YajG